MVFDLGTATEQSFPFVQVIFGSAFLWLGLNIRIIRIDPNQEDE